MTVKYFHDAADGSSVELAGPYPMDTARFAERWPGVSGIEIRPGAMMTGWSGGELQPATRRVQYKAFPSLHDCDDDCQYATGKTMTCECSCGGINHGKGR